MRPPFSLSATGETIPVAQTSFKECVDRACKAAFYYEAAERLHNTQAQHDFEQAFILAVRGCYLDEANVLDEVRKRCPVSPYTLDYLERKLGMNAFYVPPWVIRPFARTPIAVVVPPPAPSGQTARFVSIAPGQPYYSQPQGSVTFSPWSLPGGSVATSFYQPQLRPFGFPYGGLSGNPGGRRALAKLEAEDASSWTFRTWDGRKVVQPKTPALKAMLAGISLGDLALSPSDAKGYLDRVEAVQKKIADSEALVRQYPALKATGVPALISDWWALWWEQKAKIDDLKAVAQRAVLLQTAQTVSQDDLNALSALEDSASMVLDMANVSAKDAQAAATQTPQTTPPATPPSGSIPWWGWGLIGATGAGVLGIGAHILSAK